MEEMLKSEEDILEYIKREETDHYEEIFKKDNRWEVFYHLSQMRTSLLNWYEFEKESTILEIGGGFGAITGLLCRRCGRVVTFEPSQFKAEGIRIRYHNNRNLQVIDGEWADGIFEGKLFDYIFLNCESLFDKGPLDAREYIEWFSRAKRLLKEKGKLLIAAENRYGIRYFCGEVDPGTNTPFAGINRSNQAAGYFFSRHQLTQYIHKAGFRDYKFYYPLPGNQFPQLIYSDENLPQKDICERLVFYYRNKETLVALERELYADILDNQAFPFMANSFLVECGNKENFSDAIYAAVSTDRGREHSFATVVCKGDIVKKTALYPEGKKNEEMIFCNLKDMQNHGLKIVPHTRENKGLSMPYIKNITFSDHLRHLILAGDKENFLNLLERLYQQILQSSEHEEQSRSRFPLEAGRKADLGVILRKAYIDMVPFNCFYQDGDFYFFDQEFVRDYYPASYTMFRALKYTYLSISEAEALVPLEVLKEKYRLQENWDDFSREEDQFVSENRRYDIYGGFYSWTWVDKDRLRKNAEKLGTL